MSVRSVWAVIHRSTDKVPIETPAFFFLTHKYADLLHNPHFFEDHRFPVTLPCSLFDPLGNQQSTPPHLYYNIPCSLFNFFTPSIPLPPSPLASATSTLFFGNDECLLRVLYSGSEEILCHASWLVAQGCLCLSQEPSCCHVSWLLCKWLINPWVHVTLPLPPLSLWCHFVNICLSLTPLCNKTCCTID